MALAALAIVAGCRTNEQAAMEQWKATVQSIEQANDDQKGKAVEAAKPKLREIADKNPQNEAGAQALRSLILYAMDDAERAGCLETLKERFPTHPAVKEVEALEEFKAIMQSLPEGSTQQEYEAAWKKVKPGLLQILEENPRNEAGKMVLVTLLLRGPDNDEEQEGYANLLAERFLDDPFVRMLVGGDEDIGDIIKCGCCQADGV